MALTKFKDLPDTSTPINAAALNNICAAVDANTAAMVNKVDNLISTHLLKS